MKEKRSVTKGTTESKTFSKKKSNVFDLKTYHENKI